MILNKEPVTMAYVKNIVDKMEGCEDLKAYLKRFTILKNNKAEELAKEIESLDNMKIRKEHIVKVIDFMPKDSDEVNKIFTETSLSEEETNALLDIVKKY